MQVWQGNVSSPDGPSRDLLHAVTSRWGVLVPVSSGAETRRFSALRDQIGGISERMLAKTMQDLAARGLVGHAAAAEVARLVGRIESNARCMATGA